MKRLIFLTTCLALFAVFQFVANCSSPLESSNLTPPNPNPGVDTVYIFDTVFTSDTTFIVDTVIVVDTLTGVDTFIVVDTVVISDTTIITDTVFISDTVTVFDTVVVGSAGVVICSEITSNQHKIDWTFLSVPAEYHLAFEATTDRDKPTKALTIEVNGEMFYWDLTQFDNFDFDFQFTESTTLIILPDPPNGFGNGVSLCLTLQPK